MEGDKYRRGVAAFRELPNDPRDGKAPCRGHVFVKIALAIVYLVALLVGAVSAVGCLALVRTVVSKMEHLETLLHIVVSNCTM